MGLMNRLLLIFMIAIQITLAVMLAGYGIVSPDPDGMVWLAIGSVVGLMAFCIILIDSQNPRGVL